MTEIHELFVKTHFCAAHALQGYSGDCARLHGHNWGVEVFVRCEKLNPIGMGIDFRDIKRAVHNVLNNLDHFNLNPNVAKALRASEPKRRGRRRSELPQTLGNGGSGVLRL